MNNNLIEILRRFNRKERFFLVGTALDNNTFSLGKEFKKTLEKRIGIPIERDVFVAMDYHLDWIDVGLKLWNVDITIGNKFPNKDGQINKNQEDIDLIICFESAGKYHIVLLEAKAETGWTNKQMDSKVKRFRKLFGNIAEFITENAVEDDITNYVDLGHLSESSFTISESPLSYDISNYTTGEIFGFTKFPEELPNINYLCVSTSISHDMDLKNKYNAEPTYPTRELRYHDIKDLHGKNVIIIWSPVYNYSSPYDYKTDYLNMGFDNPSEDGYPNIILGY